MQRPWITREFIRRDPKKTLFWMAPRLERHLEMTQGFIIIGKNPGQAGRQNGRTASFLSLAQLVGSLEMKFVDMLIDFFAIYVRCL